MSRGNIMNNTKTRRKGSMLQDSISKIKYLLVLAFLLVLPMQAMAGGGGGGLMPLIDQTDTGVDRLVYYWDSRDRDSFLQLTNTSSSTIVVHVQVFDVNDVVSICNEVDFDDVYTAGDTHVYDVEDMVSNCDADGGAAGANPNCGSAQNSDFSDSYGFVVISYSFTYDGPDAHYAMIGMFRIIDGPGGYEYRANAAGEDFFAEETVDFVLNFNDVDGNDLSDVVGIVYTEVGDDTVFADPGLGLQLGSLGGALGPQNLIFDESEGQTSCSPTVFSCQVGNLNKGIDNSIPNSRQQVNRICNTSVLSDSNDAGWLYLPAISWVCTTPGFVDTDGTCLNEFDMFFASFLGLNNNNGTGSMDSWLAKRYYDNFVDMIDE